MVGAVSFQTLVAGIVTAGALGLALLVSRGGRIDAHFRLHQVLMRHRRAELSRRAVISRFTLRRLMRRGCGRNA